MFASPDDARRALKDAFEPDLVQSIVAGLVPSIVLAPTGRDRLGGTRLGGTPDLPAGLAWPRPPAPGDAEAIARRANDESAAAMRDHFAHRLPYTFIAQIDLDEVAALGAVASPLPAEGRLLFFYELFVGPWEIGTRVARVIWDRAPRESLKASELPADLADAAARLQALIVQVLAKHGRSPKGDGNTYRLPSLPRAAQATLRLPSTRAVEIEAIPAIAPCAFLVGASDAEEEPCLAYSDVLEANDDDFPDEIWRRHQLLGSPMPEQDDPRYEAVTFARFGEQALSHDDWMAQRDEIFAGARDWRLLLQVALPDWEDHVSPGTAYFLIRADDLEARRFEGVIAVYQQT